MRNRFVSWYTRCSINTITDSFDFKFPHINNDDYEVADASIIAFSGADGPIEYTSSKSTDYSKLDKFQLKVAFDKLSDADTTGNILGSGFGVGFKLTSRSTALSIDKTAH